MAIERKNYKLLPGKTHRVPNPNYIEGKDDAATESHVQAKEGDIVQLTDEQYKSFKDKFIPVGSDASSVRDRDAEELETAKVQAAKTGQMVDPNKAIVAGANK